MLYIDDIVSATIVELKPYGMYLKSDSDQILVLLPEISWEPLRDLKQIYSEGDIISVKMLEFIPTEELYKGSIRQLRPEDNPYNQLLRFKNKVMQGMIKGIYSDDVTVALPHNVWGHIPIDEIDERLKVGDEIFVRVKSVDPEQCELKLTFAGRKQ
ncbi:MAG: hypothetical protein ETSY1_22025 [Candidatus Entotheonella factor]|uniref:S1 motif domain-containing protein n=1 Tax=Entotheonella factor TaxID=1429438 RepID=W4LJS6_ENTF1|nr:MAG: hypothetical protein ETSY1_22025 [Candidatus Entotheonella factor]